MRLLNKFLLPLQCVTARQYRLVNLAWILAAGLLWTFSPFIFLPQPHEVVGAIHDMWLYGDLAREVAASVWLNVEAISIAAAISLLLVYASTIMLLRPICVFVGKLGFLSLAGLGFAFTLMTTSGHALRLAVLVFMVTVYFVVSMMDAIAAIPQEQYDLARTLKMGDWEVLWEVVVLGQLDQAFVVLRQTAKMSWAFVAVAEGMSMSGGGIGMLLNTSSKHFHLAEIMALQLIVLVIGWMVQDQLIGKLREWCCPWVAGGGERA